MASRPPGPAYSRRLARISTTTVVLSLAPDARVAFLDDIDRHESVSQLMPEHQTLIARAEAEL